jgi:subtilisin family serine protease
LETGRPEVIIAVIDSGVAFDHPDLADNIWTNPGEIPGNGRDDDGNGYVDDIHGWDFVNDDANPSDYSRDLYGNGHGTHVAGIIAARGDNGRGVTGVMWHASLMPLQIFDIYESDSYRDAVIQSFNIIAAIHYAVDNGARIINCSFGGPVPSQIQQNVIAAAAAAGVLVVVAAGNDGLNNDLEPTYPAAYDLPNIIAVAAVDNRDELSSYSNYGPRSVDVAAPGGGSGNAVYSTLPPARETIFSDDFEAGADAWRTWSRWEDWSLGYDDWGSRVVRDSVGNYHNNEFSGIRTARRIDTTGYRGVLFRFLVDYDLEDGYDYFRMALLWADGEREEAGALTGRSLGWQEYLAWSNDDDLGRFYLEFRLETDGSVNYDGVQLDDIEVTGIRWEYEGTEYGWKQGTSMACPVVSGVAGLIWSRRPDLTYLEVRRLIVDNVDPIPDLSGKVASGGRVNAWRALAAALALPVEPVAPTEGTVPDGSPATAAMPVELVAGAPLIDPAAVTVRVAAGPVSIAPRLRVADCAALYRPLLFVRIPGAEPEFTDLTPLVTSRCTAGVLIIDLGTIDLTGYPGTYDLFYGYVTAAGDIFYHAYRMVAGDVSN